jgi:glycosyltransferase involved in cell wall biosynthesis
VGSLYLPAADAGASPVFYGAVNLYLRHRFPALRRMPALVGRALDARGLLRLAGRLSGASDAASLDGLTLSMLRGEEGGQAEELSRLMSWIDAARPDAVHLSNCLLTGIARRVRRELGAVVACSLQDEDMWVDAMAETSRAAVWKLLGERAADVDVFAAVSRHYARFMAGRISIPEERIEVVPIGIDIDGFEAAPSGLPFDPPVIGFLSRVSKRMGAGLLMEAFIRLSEAGRFPGLRLRAMGGATASDAVFLRSMRRELARHGLLSRFDYVRPFDREDRAEFLRSITLLSVPVPEGEAFGTFLLEAMACGVPVVQPRLGGFSELVEETGGGILYEPNTSATLAEAIEGLLADRRRGGKLGGNGREAVRSRYTAAHMAAGLERAIVKAMEARKGRG